jgi:glycosyltransferase involved in cell wall biosynthesis
LPDFRVDHWCLGKSSYVLHYPMCKGLVENSGLQLSASISSGNPRLNDYAALGIPVRALSTNISGRSAVRAINDIVSTRKQSHFLGFTPMLRHVYMVSPWDNIYLPFAKSRNSKLLVTVHDGQRHLGEENRILQVIESGPLHMADHLVAISAHVRDILLERLKGKKPVHLIEGGLVMEESGRPQPARPAPRNRPLRIIFFGRLHHYKGFDILVDALKILKAEGVAFQFVVAASGDLSAFERDMKFLNAEVHNAAWLADEVLNGAIASADINVLPYREASQSAVVIKALWQALPTVATAIGGLKEQLHEGRDCLFAAAPEAGAIAQCLKRIIQEPRLYEALSRGAHGSAEASSPKAVAQRWEDLYREIMTVRSVELT